jgi:macrophage erythroblast attacher
LQNTFERELRLQQYIEMIRCGNPVEAAAHARKYLMTTGSRFGFRWTALLCYDSNTDIEPFAAFFAKDRWDRLADMFLYTHHHLLSMPQRPLLHIALTAGLSALKTPACHSKFVSPTSGLNSSRTPTQADVPTEASLGSSHHSHHRHHHMEKDESMSSVSAPVAALINTPVCPICSTELNKLAEPLPYAHHSKSHVESDPVVLPNGRIYGSDRLSKLNEKLGTPKGKVRDPSEPSQMYNEAHIRKVYIM